MSGRLHVRLYIAGDSPNSVAAEARLRAMLAEFGDDAAELEIIDVLRDPERGLRDRVLVTPMLVKVEPGPERRVLGSLGDRSRVMTALGLARGTS